MLFVKLIRTDDDLNDCSPRISRASGQHTCPLPDVRLDTVDKCLQEQPESMSVSLRGSNHRTVFVVLVTINLPVKPNQEEPCVVSRLEHTADSGQHN